MSQNKKPASKKLSKSVVGDADVDLHFNQVLEIERRKSADFIPALERESLSLLDKCQFIATHAGGTVASALLKEGISQLAKLDYYIPFCNDSDVSPIKQAICNVKTSIKLMQESLQRHNAQPHKLFSYDIKTGDPIDELEISPYTSVDSVALNGNLKSSAITDLDTEFTSEVIRQVKHQKTLVKKYIDFFAHLEILGESGLLLPHALADSLGDEQVILFEEGVVLIVYANDLLEIVFDIRCANTVRTAVANGLSELKSHKICDDPQVYCDDENIFWGSEALLAYAHELALDEQFVCDDCQKASNH